MKKKHIGLFIAALSIFFNIILFVFKFIVGYADHSVAIIADAWHTLSDSITSSLVFIGFVIALKPADKEHPYGHGRIESIISIMVGTLLAVVGVNFFIMSIKSFLNKNSAEFGILAIIVNIVTIIVKEILARISISQGKKINAFSLIADGWHHRSDALSSVVILTGILLSGFFWWIDSVLGVLVSLFIFHTAYSVIKSSGNSLLGTSISKEFEKSVTQCLMEQIPEIKNAHHFHLHDYGDHKELTLHIRLLPSMNIQQAHTIATLAEERIKAKHKMEVTIHIEPD